MRILYNILFLIVFVLASPYYFWRLRRRGDWLRGFGQRFARYDPSIKQALTNRDTIWLHAVSVGEVNLCTQLINALEPRLPNIKIVVSCTTTTGMAELEVGCRRTSVKFIIRLTAKDMSNAPGDHQPQGHRAGGGGNLAEFSLARRRNLNIPVFLANARLSDRSYPRYKKFGFLFRPLFAAFAGVGAQNEEDAHKLREVGCRAGKRPGRGQFKI